MPNFDYEAEIQKALANLSDGFLRTPTVWFVILMADEGRKCANGGRYKAPHHSFWKFLLKLWHETLYKRSSKKALSAKLSLRQFGIRPKDAHLWATAVIAGGLYTVDKGDFRSRVPSTYVYNSAADTIVWQGFYRGLMRAYEEWVAFRKETREAGIENMQVWAEMVKTCVADESEELRRELNIRGAGATTHK